MPVLMGRWSGSCLPSTEAEFSPKLLRGDDAALTIYLGKPRKMVCILSSVRATTGLSDGLKAKLDLTTCFKTLKMKQTFLVRQQVRKYGHRLRAILGKPYVCFKIMIYLLIRFLSIEKPSHFQLFIM